MTTENQLALVPHTHQGSLIHQRSQDGFINGTAMCKAVGKLYNDYSRLKNTGEFFAALSGSTGIPVDRLTLTIASGPNEARGTWVHPQVAINLAQWASPEFAVKVTEWVYDWMLGRDPTDRIWAQFEDRVSLVYDNVPAGYWCVFREIADLFAALISRGIDPGTRMILDISVGLHWSKYWKEQDLEASFGERQYFDHYYPEMFSQAFSNPQVASCYPDEALAVFRRWVREVYVPQKMPAYLKSQVSKRKIPAQLANNAIAALEQRAANRALPRKSA
ncbi:KilA-N domain-containing protein [Croceicoccus sp. BE223]|uniref:KilA-N domain-containing protein n=1 Tax=Croceicoccus sp. BE223 TaxID=2817716 RepID=UPI0028618453|nr:KilA-N domain-containing protein [Croceicoccus sp. BE223]MDR7101547.1 hypothetical protein [Croceicoccus sp. BE223]